MVVVVRGRSVVAADAGEHPGRHADDDQARGELKPGLQSFDIEFPGEMHANGRQHPNDEGMRKGSGEAEQGGLRDGAANGNDEGGHHRFAVAGLKPVERAKQNHGWQEQSALTASEVILE